MPATLPPDPPILYLHCGAYKTGTSSMQGFFSIHREQVLRDYGLLYPLAGGRNNSGVSLPGRTGTACYAHHLLAHFARKSLQKSKGARRDFEDLVGAIQQEFVASRAKALFLSTELLTSSSPKLRHLLIKRFQNFQIKIIYCVRHPVDYVESMNNQILGAGAKKLCDLKRLPFLANVEAWAELLGHNNVKVVAFNRQRFSEYASEFFDGIESPGLSGFAVPRVPRLNSSISLEGVTVRRLISRYLPERMLLGPGERHEMDLMINEIDRSIGQRTPLVTLSMSERETLLSLNAEDVQILADRYLPHSSKDCLLDNLAPQISVKKNTGGNCYFSGADVKMIVRSLAKRNLIEPSMPELDDSAAVDSTGLEAILDKIPPVVNSIPFAKRERLVKRATQIARERLNNVCHAVESFAARMAFELMRNDTLGSAMLKLPNMAKKPLAGFLSRRSYHVQALSLASDKAADVFLRAGIHTPFNDGHAKFSPSFSLLEGGAWLSAPEHELPPTTELVAWLGRFSPNQKEKALAIICQVGFADLKKLVNLLSPGFVKPLWLSAHFSQMKKPSPYFSTDLNQNLLSVNYFKSIGDESLSATLMEMTFRQYRLPPPPRDLFAGYSPSPVTRDFPAEARGPKITVIICAWNAAAFLPVALASILGQTYPNLEVIAINDGSSDETAAVFDEWLLGRSEVRIVHRSENLGTYASRNEGLRLATGDYVTFHDADDWSSPEKIQRQWEAISSDKLALASSSEWFRIDDRTGLCYTRRVFPLCRWNCSSFLFHRTSAMEALGFYDEVRTGADSEYVARFEAYFGAHRHVRLRLPLSIGLEHSGSLTGASETGFDLRGLSRARQDYQEMWRSWHAAAWRIPGGLKLKAGETISARSATLLSR